MKARFFRRKRFSKDFAKDRLESVLFSERINCSPDTIRMMKNDIMQAVGKYLPVDENGVKLRYVASERRIEAMISLHSRTESGQKG